MSDYAIVNLLELDDSTGGRAPGLEGRFGRSKLGARDIGVSHWRYAPNFRSPASHSHREQEEAYVVVAGYGKVRLDDEVHGSGCGTRSVSRPPSSARSRRALTGST